jgi:hypothetical protein
VKLPRGKLLCHCRLSAPAFVALLILLLAVAPELTRQAVSHGVPAGDGLYNKPAATGVARTEIGHRARPASPTVPPAGSTFASVSGYVAEFTLHPLLPDARLLRWAKLPLRHRVLGCGSRAPPFLA